MSKESPALREQQAHKILNLLRDFTDPRDSLYTKLCLDIGCGSGEISYYLSRDFKTVVGVDIELDRVKLGNYHNHKIFSPNYAIADGSILPFSTCSIDIIVCAQVYEHTINQRRLLNEIWRVLKPNGVCFFSGPNKYAILEEHYFLPFLSWLPSSIADAYMRTFKKGPVYDVLPLSHSRLLSLMDGFYVKDLTLELIKKSSKLWNDGQIWYIKSITLYSTINTPSTTIFYTKFQLHLAKTLLN